MGKFSEFKLPLKSLAQGSHVFEYHLDKQFFANMENNDVRDADINVVLTVTYRHDVYELDFKISGTVTLLCDRCLDDLIVPIDTKYHLLVKYGDDYNDDSDELIEIPQSDNFLNVSYMIYDTVVLAIPIKHVHPLGKCNRQMSALLKKHRAGGPASDDPDADIQEELLDSVQDGSVTDPRWDALKGIASDSDPDTE